MSKVVFPSFSGTIFSSAEMRQLVSALELRFQALELATQDSTYPSTEVGAEGEFAPVDHTHVEADITDLGNYLTDITAESIFNLSDVIGTPSGGQVLIWNGSAFQPGTVATSGVSELDDLTDVDAASPVDNDILRYNAATQTWEAEQLTETGGAEALDDLTDVFTSGQTTYDLLVNADGVNWVPTEGALSWNRDSSYLQLANTSSINWQAFEVGGGVGTSEQIAFENTNDNPDSNLASVTCLISAETAAAGSTSFAVDIGDFTIQKQGTGTGEISSEQAKFGTRGIKIAYASGVNYGQMWSATTGDDAYRIDSGDGGNWTFELHLYMDNFTAATQQDLWRVGGNTTNESYAFRFDSLTQFTFNYSPDGTTTRSVTCLCSALSLDTWYHIAWVRDGDDLRMYVDGFLESDNPNFFFNTVSEVIFWPTSPTTNLFIIANDGFAQWYLDNIRLTRGVARYTSNFAAPTAAYDDGSGVSTLTVGGTDSSVVIPTDLTISTTDFAFPTDSALTIGYTGENEDLRMIHFVETLGGVGSGANVGFYIDYEGVANSPGNELHFGSDKPSSAGTIFYIGERGQIVIEDNLNNPASLTSTEHPLQIGPTTGLNLRFGRNEIQAVNNGTDVTTLSINPWGGDVRFFESDYTTDYHNFSLYLGKSGSTSGRFYLYGDSANLNTFMYWLNNDLVWTGGFTTEDLSFAGFDTVRVDDTSAPKFQVGTSVAGSMTRYIETAINGVDAETNFLAVTDWNISGFTGQINVTGELEADDIIAGDPGTEGGSITVNGTTYDSVLKASDIGGTHAAQFIMHRHSTTLPSLIIGARSKTDDSTHAIVADNDNLLNILAAGWDGVDSYSLSSEIRMEVDGTPGANDMPGQITFMTSADGTETPIERMRIRSTGNVEMDYDLSVTGDLTVSGTTTTINSNTVAIADNIILLNSDATDPPSENAGLEIERGGVVNNVFLRWNETSDRWEFTNDGTTYYDLLIETEIDHGNLVGLGDDDHPQYAQHASSEVISGDWTFEADVGSTLLQMQKVSATDDAQFQFRNELGVLRFNILINNTTADDFRIARYNDSGVFQESSMGIDSTTGDITFAGNVNASAGVDVTGNITVTGTVDGRDVATDGTNQDTHIADSTIHFTEASIDHGSIAGLGDDDHPQYTQHATAESITGNWTFEDTAFRITGNSGTSAWGTLTRGASTDDIGFLFRNESNVNRFAQYLTTGNNLAFAWYNTGGVFQGTALNISGLDGTATFAGNVNADQGLDVTGNITVTGNVDGRDVATDGTNQDNHIADSTIHFTQAAISIPLSQISDVTATAAEVNLLDLAGLTAGWVLSADTATTASWKQLSHTSLSDIGTNTHAQIDTHIADGTVHFTKGSILLDELGDVVETTITTGDLLRWDGANWVNYPDSNYQPAGSYLTDIVQDTTPQLGGNLDVQANVINTSTVNGDISIQPNGTGNVLLGNFEFDADQTVGVGQDNYVLTYDHSTTSISLEVAPSGATNLTWTASTRTVASDTGTDAVITLFTATEAGLAPLSGGGTTNYLRADGTWASPPGGSASNSFETQTVTDTDSGYTWAATGSAVADSSTDTLTWVSGTGIDIDVDATSDAIRITNTFDTLAESATDVTATAAEVNLLDLAGLTAGWGLIADTATTASWQQIDHVDLANIGTNTHAQIDTHIALTNEHIDWTSATQNLSTTGTVSGSNINDTNWDTAYTITQRDFNSNPFINTGRQTTTPDTVGDTYGVNFQYLASSATPKPSGLTDGALTTLSYSAAWQTQMLTDWRNNGRIWIRGQENTVWTSWEQVWSSADFSIPQDEIAFGVTGGGAIESSSGFTYNGVTLLVTGTDQVMSIKGGASDHAYVGFYADAAAQSTRSAFVGFGAAASETFQITNEFTNGGILLNPNGTGVVTVGGDLTVNGTTTTVNSNTVSIADNIILLNSDEAGVPSQDAGLEVERGTSANVFLQYDETADRWEFTNDGSTYYNIPISTEYTTDHTALSNIGTNTHAQIDTHIADSTIHFTKGSILLDDLGDVTETTITAGDLLRWNGSAWVNYADSNYAASGHTHLLAAGATDVTATAAELNLLDLSGLTVGWVLSADSATTASWKAPTGGGIDNVVEDTTPELGGPLDIGTEHLFTSAVADTIRIFDDFAGTTEYHRFYTDGSGYFMYGGTHRIYAPASVLDYTSMSHDGAIFTMAHTSTTDFDITGLTADVRIRDGAGLKIQNTTDTGYVRQQLNVADFEITSNIAIDWIWKGFTDIRIEDGATFEIWDSGDTDSAQFQHDGTDFTTTFINTAEWEISGTSQIRLLQDNAELVLQSTTQNIADSAQVTFMEGLGTQIFGSTGYGFRWTLDGSTNDMILKSGNLTTVTDRIKVGRDSGDISLGNFRFNTAQTVGAGQDNYVLTYDNATGDITLEAPTGGSQTPWTSDIDGGGFGLDNIDRLEIQDGTAADSATFTHGGVHFQTAFVGTTDWKVYGLGGAFEINNQAASSSTLRIGESTTLRGDAQDARIDMYAEQTSSIYLSRIQNSGPFLQFQIATNQAVQWSGDGDYQFQLRDGAEVVIYDSGDTDFISLQHDGTNFNIAATNTDYVDFLSVNTGVRFRDGVALEIYDSTDTSWLAINHDGTDVNWVGNNTTDFILQGLTWFKFLDGSGFALYDSTNADEMNMKHDGTDFNVNFVGTTDWNYGTGLRSIVLQETTLDHWQGGAQGSDQIRHIKWPKGASFKVDTASQTGAILITLPNTSALGNMAHYTIRGTDYTTGTGAWTLYLGGYDYITNQEWNTLSSAVLVGSAPFEVVKFMEDSTTDQLYIQLGETTDVWQYPQVWIEEITVAFSGQGNENLADGWTISQTTSETGRTTKYTRHVLSQWGTGSNIYFDAGSATSMAFWGGTDFQFVNANETDKLTITPGTSDTSFDSTQNIHFRAAAGHFVYVYRSGEAMSFRVYDGTGADYIAFSHDGTDANTTFAGTTDWNITGANVVFNGEIDVGNRVNLSGSTPFMIITETDVTNTPAWWWGADGGNLSLRLNNTGTYPITIATNGTNDAVTDITLGYDTIITGDLTVNGATTTINSNTVSIADNIIVLNSDEAGAPTQNAGIEVERGTSANVQFYWNETTDAWNFTDDVTFLSSSSIIVAQGGAPAIDFTSTGGPLGLRFSAGKATSAQVDLVYRTTPEVLYIERVSDGADIAAFDPSDLSTTLSSLSCGAGTFTGLVTVSAAIEADTLERGWYGSTVGARVQVGTDGSGHSGVLGSTQHTDTGTLDYRTYWAYDAHWDEANNQWEANRTSLGKKWLVQMGYHQDSLKIRRFDGTVSAPWADSAWSDLVTISNVGGATFAGQVNANAGLALNNTNITAVNALSFNDPGPGEGITWTGGNWSIYDSPNDLVTNTAGNLQFVSGGVRRMTVETDGRVYAGGGFSVPYVAASTSPMMTLENAETYGLFHTEGTPDFFEFQHAGTWQQRLSGDGSMRLKGRLVAENHNNFLQYYNPGWTNATTHDVLKNTYTVTTGDILLIKASGNSTGSHGILGVGDNGLYWGRTDQETNLTISDSDSPFDSANYWRVDELGHMYCREATLANSGGSEMLTLQDTGGAGTAADPYIAFRDSANTRIGYVGVGSGSTNDVYVLSDSGSIQLTAGSGTIEVNDILDMNNNNINDANRVYADALYLNETSAAQSDVAGDGQVWVKNNAPCDLMYTGDTGLDYYVGYAEYRLYANQSDTVDASYVNRAWYSDNATAYTLTLESGATTNFPVGGQFTIWNEGSGTLTINENATSCTLYLLDGSARTDTAGGCTMGTGGYATVIRKSATVWLIMGAGITA